MGTRAAVILGAALAFSAIVIALAIYSTHRHADNGPCNDPFGVAGQTC